VKGIYIATAKNEMVSEFYTKMGFALLLENSTTREYELELASCQPILTKIQITQRSYESN
jgi:predicted enzyme involved in methoxymalonyl-ACP biosynthesis